MNQKEWNEKERTEKKCKKKKGRILTTEHERYGREKGRQKRDDEAKSEENQTHKQSVRGVKQRKTTRRLQDCKTAQTSRNSTQQFLQRHDYPTSLRSKQEGESAAPQNHCALAKNPHQYVRML